MYRALEFKAVIRWTRSRWKRVVLGSLILACLTLNALAYRHAWSMTHFVESGERPPPPEKMSLGQKASAIFTGVEGAGHENLSVARPDEWRAAVERFLAGIGVIKKA